jgi:hypothetical protein
MADEEQEPRPGEVCGTYAMYQKHYKRGDKPCQDCAHAHAVYMNRWRRRNGRTKTAAVPYAVLGELLLALPTDMEEWAEKQLGDAVVTNAIEAAEEARGCAS